MAEDGFDELIEYVRGLGASDEEIASTLNLGELALDLHLRPERPTTVRQVVEEAAFDPQLVRRLTTALGLPSDVDEPITAQEAAVVRTLTAASRDLLGEDAAVQVARVAGAAMARVAEAVVTAFRLQFELPRQASGTRYVDVVKEYAVVAETLLPEFVSALDAMLRRQIIAVAERMWSTDPSRTTVTLPRTVGFADLVGYTERTAGLPLTELTRVLVEFDERTAEVVASHGGQVVKTIGDEVLFVTEDARAACAIALDLVERLPVRVGLARGEVLSVFGDVYGPDVNLASRLVEAAEPESVLASDSVRAACEASFTFEATELLELKGFPEPQPAFRLTR